MQQRSQIIERNKSEFADYSHLLIFGLPANDDVRYLNAEKVITWDYRVYQSHQTALEEQLVFSLDETETDRYDAVIVYLPKSKGELDLALAYIAPMLQAGAEIFLVGEKKAGIASAAKKLDQFGAKAGKIDSAKHCQLWQVSLDAEVKAFNLADWMESFSITINERSVEIATIPGVFSYGELDDGTRLLLENMFSKLEGRVLDFGCGSGVLGVYTKLINPFIQLEMVDISLLALTCAQRTCELNKVEAKVYASDGWKGVTGRVNALVTNPPFHSGVNTEYQTTEGFIREAKDKMTKHAPFLLVANNFLKYAHIIEGIFGRCDVLAENTKFKIYKTYR
jgi:16S rRNA (guanine1207-N2)-methyltransferase